MRNTSRFSGNMILVIVAEASKGKTPEIARTFEKFFNGEDQYSRQKVQALRGRLNDSRAQVLILGRGKALKHLKDSGLQPNNFKIKPED